MKKYFGSYLKSKIQITAIGFFLVSLFFLSFNLNKPFYGEHDWNGARYGNIARNYLKYGLIQTKLGQVENSGYVFSDPLQYFTHYPPVLTLLIALSYKVFGIFEWSTRLVPVLATSLVISLIFLIGSKIVNFKVGFIAALLSLATPLVLYFGKSPVHEVLVVCFVLFAFFSYLNIATRKIYQVFFVVSLILAMLTTWAGFFLVPALTLTAWLKRDYAEVRSLSGYLILSVVVFLGYLTFTYLLTGSLLGGDLVGVALQRSGLSQAGRIEGLNPLTYLFRLRLWLFTLYTTTLILLSLYWLLGKILTVKNHKKLNQADWAVFSLGFFGLIYLILFPNATFLHNYLVFYLLPFMSLSASLALVKLTNLKQVRKYSLFLIIMTILLVGWERLSFLQALNSSNADRLAVEVGKAIKTQSNKNDTVLVTPAKFGNSADNFLKYYSDRKIIYSTAAASVNLVVTVDLANQTFQLEKNQ